MENSVAAKVQIPIFDPYSQIFFTMQQTEPCPFCGQFAGYVFVHGHYQCLNCGQNVVPCCEGSGYCAPAHPLYGMLTNALKLPL